MTSQLTLRYFDSEEFRGGTFGINESHLVTTIGTTSTNMKRGWGGISQRAASGPGFCISQTNFTIEYPVRIECSPSEPVLNLHVQVSNGCLMSYQSVREQLLVQDQYILFNQERKPSEFYFFAGSHAHFNVIYAARFLQSVMDDTPEIHACIEEVLGIEDTRFDPICVLTPRMLGLVADLNDLMAQGRVDTQLYREYATKFLRQCF